MKVGFGVRKLSRRVITPPFLPGKNGHLCSESSGSEIIPLGFYVNSGLRSAEIIPPARRGPAGQLAGRQAGRQGGLPAGRLVPADWPAGWLTNRPAGPAGQLAGLLYRGGYTVFHKINHPI